jgi:hypothetical protein
MGPSPGRRGRWAWLALLGVGIGALAWLAYTHARRDVSAGDADDGPEKRDLEAEPRPGDILLFHHAPKLKDRLIAWFTRSVFYHTALYAGDRHVIESRPQGVIHNDLRGREDDFVVVRAPGEKGGAALAWAETQLGDPYDRMDWVVIILEHLFRHLHLNYTPRSKFTCAELVATAFDRAGVRLFPDIDLADTVPADFARLLPPEAVPRT